MYEAIDHASMRGGVVIRSFMAHHQAMTLLSLANVLLDGAVRRRFHAEPMVQATEYLLSERLPALLDIVVEEEQPVLELPAAQAASPLAEM
jgi:cyclic beta-1,2-glucan synthetase